MQLNSVFRDTHGYTKGLGEEKRMKLLEKFDDVVGFIHHRSALSSLLATDCRTPRGREEIEPLGS